MAYRLFEKSHPARIPKPDDVKIRRRNQGGRGRDTDTRRDPQRENPPRYDKDLGAGRGPQRGERTGTGNGDRRRHAGRGAGTSGRGWQVAGAGDAQVGGVFHQERRWGAGEMRGLIR